MVLRKICIVFLLMVAVGCSKKKGSSGGGGTTPGNDNTPNKAPGEVQEQKGGDVGAADTKKNKQPGVATGGGGNDDVSVPDAPVSGANSDSTNGLYRGETIKGIALGLLKDTPKFMGAITTLMDLSKLPIKIPQYQTPYTVKDLLLNCVTDGDRGKFDTSFKVVHTDGNLLFDFAAQTTISQPLTQISCLSAEEAVDAVLDKASFLKDVLRDDKGQLIIPTVDTLGNDKVAINRSAPLDLIGMELVSKVQKLTGKYGKASLELASGTNEFHTTIEDFLLTADKFSAEFAISGEINTKFAHEGATDEVKVEFTQPLEFAIDVPDVLNFESNTSIEAVLKRGTLKVTTGKNGKMILKISKDPKAVVEIKRKIPESESAFVESYVSIAGEIELAIYGPGSTSPDKVLTCKSTKSKMYHLLERLLSQFAYELDKINGVSGIKDPAISECR